MNLYEITNGYVGESYVRVYVWAKDDEQAYGLAEERFGKAGYPEEAPLSLKVLFSQDAQPFCTIPSDEGFVMEYIDHG
jgi:hypothetical protein